MTQFLKNTDPRFHLVELRSKTFTFLILAILLSIVGFAAFKQEWFRPVKHYWLIAETSEGLQQGMSVRLSGFRIGRVQKIELVANRQVRVDFEVFDEYTTYIRKETHAKLRGETLIGDRFIELDLDRENGGSSLLPEGSEIDYHRGKNIDEMVESLEKKFTPILDSLGSFTEALPKTVTKLDHTIDQANGLLTDLRSDEGYLVSGLQSLKQALNDFSELAATLQNEDSGLMVGVASFNETADTLNTKIGPLIDSLQSGSATLNETAIEARKLFVDADEMVKNLNQIVEKSSADVPIMIKKGAAAANKADDVIDSVRRMWPVRRGVADESDDLLRTGSDD